MDLLPVAQRGTFCVARCWAASLRLTRSSPDATDDWRPRLLFVRRYTRRRRHFHAPQEYTHTQAELGSCDDARTKQRRHPFPTAGTPTAYCSDARASTRTITSTSVVLIRCDCVLVGCQPLASLRKIYSSPLKSDSGSGSGRSNNSSRPKQTCRWRPLSNLTTPSTPAPRLPLSSRSSRSFQRRRQQPESAVSQSPTR